MEVTPLNCKGSEGVLSKQQGDCPSINKTLPLELKCIKCGWQNKYPPNETGLKPKILPPAAEQERR